MEHNNVIELNGKRYDALTGKYLGKSHAKPVPAAQPSAKGRTIDDVAKRPARTDATEQTAGQAKTTHTRAAPRAVRRHKAHRTHPHRPEHAKTLMRHAVKKPDVTLKPKIKPQSSAGIAAAPASKLAPKKSAAQVDPVRMQRARSAVRHSDVQRFGSSAANLAARPVPATHHKQVRAAYQAPRAAAHHNRHDDIFERAIAHAKSHEQPTPKIARYRHRRKRARHIAAAVALLLIAGLALAWLQKPQIELHLASFQAGFEASLPSYHLTDYKRGAIRQEHGRVVAAYHSGDRYYRITQQASDWNSQTLLDTAVAGASTEDSQVLESKGRLIYLYEGNNATWVDGGVRYDITGNAALKRDDILKIVESM